MSEGRLRLADGGPADPFTLRLPPGPARPLDAVRDALHGLRSAGVTLVQLERPDVLPDTLGDVVAAARALGLTVALRGLAVDDDPRALAALGVAVIVAPLHGPAPVHDALAGAGSHATVRTALGLDRAPRVRLWTALSARNEADLHDVARHGGQVDRITLSGDVPAPLHGDRLAAALDRVWRAAAGVARLELVDAHVPPEPSRGPIRRLDANLVALRAAGGWLPGLAAGVEADVDPPRAATLHALGMPVVGGSGPLPYPPADGPVVVVVPHLGDALLALSTLPGLVDALRARGVDARLESVWERPWNLRAPVPGGDLAARTAAIEGERQRAATVLSGRMLDAVDLSGARRVLVPGFAAAARLRANPTLPPDAVVEAIDLHLLDGLGAWPGEGAPDLVTGCFPGFVAGYLARGVPDAVLRFRPYPVARAHLPPARPGGAVLVAGNQRRDHATLATALAAADVGPVRVVAREPLGVPGAVDLGHLPLAALVDEVAAASLVVLPVESRPHDAAGITLAALALALGRPVVGTTAWGLVDHVRHGVSGLLVPPADPRALAAALRRACEPALHARLADGARAAGALLDVEAWADALVGRPAAVWPTRGPVDDDPLR